MPFRSARASASARFSSSRRVSGVRAVTRARPSRTSTVFAHTPSSRSTYARWRLYASTWLPSVSRRTQRCSTSSASLSRAARANGAAVSKPRPISGASIPRSLTRPIAATSTVSPSMTARTRTGSERCTAVAGAGVYRCGMEVVASIRLAATSRNFIAISSDRTWPERAIAFVQTISQRERPAADTGRCPTRLPDSASRCHRRWECVRDSRRLIRPRC
jgi:hypothetical protein